MPEGVQIALLDRLAVVRLTSWQTALPDHIDTSFASRLVPTGLGGQIRPLNLGPGEWLMVSDVIAGVQLHDRLHQHLTGQPFAVVDLSCGVKTVSVSGPAVRELLSKGCGLDLHPNSFPAGRSTRTRFAQVSAVLDCFDPKPQFDLYVNRSYVTYLRSWLEDAALELTGTAV